MLAAWQRDHIGGACAFRQQRREHVYPTLQLGDLLVSFAEAFADDVEQLVAVGRDSFDDEAAKPLVEGRLYSVVGSCVGPRIPVAPRAFAVGRSALRASSMTECIHLSTKAPFLST
jgi:hypothetical protein